MNSKMSALRRSLVAFFVGAIIFPSHIVRADDALTDPPPPSKTPTAEVRDTLDQILVVVEKYPGKDQEKPRREKLRQVINPKFDFKEMSQRSLGALWKERTPEEQKEFVDVFSNLLAKTYLAKVELVRRDTVKIDKEEVDGARALVKTIITYNGDKFPLDYKMMNKNGMWQVFDVVVENIGLVANYRNEFAGVIRKDGFEGLMTQLKDKVAHSS